MAEVVIEKSSKDLREYKYFILPNDIKCLVVSDPETQLSSASMNVHIGSVHEDIHGLAHFLEHMLFLGTSKYPIENEYSNFLTSHGGYSNAFTASEDTNYFFKVSSEHLHQSLDLFAQFFISPLFNADSVSRELKAVDSEYNKNILDDNWRFYQIMRNSMNSPYNHFGLGSSKTLDFEGIRDKVIEFYGKYYSANLMSLVVYGKESVSVLEKWVEEMFVEVVNKKIVLNELVKPVFGDLGTLTRVVPVKKMRNLRLVWTLPAQFPLYQFKPDRYISNLLGHEGKNSILSYLKYENLAEELTSYLDDFYSTCSVVFVDIKLTEKGLAQYEHIMEVVSQYTEYLRTHDPEEYIFEELKAVAFSQFTFKNKEDPIWFAQRLASKLGKYPSEKVLVATELFETFDKNIIKEMIGYLNPQNMQAFLVSEDFDKSTMEQEKYYGTYMLKEDIKPELKQKLENPNVDTSQKQLSHPTVNPYITTSHEVLDLISQKYPEEILKNDKCRVWHKQNSKFAVDKVHGQLLLFCNSIGFDNNVYSYVLGDIWVKLLKEKIREEVYLADIAGLDYDISIDTHGIRISLGGFAQKYAKFFEYLVKVLGEFKVEIQDECTFNDIKGLSVIQLKNMFLGKPYEQVQRLVYESNLYGGYFSVSDKLKALEKTEFVDLCWFAQKWLKNVFFEWIIIGNLTKDSVITMANNCINSFESIKSPSYMSPSEFLLLKVLKIPKNSPSLYKSTLIEPSETNCAVLSQWQLGPETDNSQATLALIENYLEEPCFNVLRTQEQLGYIVWSYPHKIRGIQNISFLVQSSVKCPSYIFTRITAFLEQMKTEIEKISDEEFNTLIESCKKKNFKKDISIKDEYNRFKYEVDTAAYCFDRKKKIKGQLKDIKKEDLALVYDKIFFKDNRRLDLEVLAQKMIDEENALIGERSVENDLNMFWRRSKTWQQVYIRK
ncbi:hypothetical protein SteCoe_15629 [Stentor coeruleus]|uniref:Insulin-degrading enzyme n=1 Tax=Stentor coeruleus TaxID=5963 RepID=A0A1R2C3B6_9CILI|nr:hypothetical protein SteCoe_15629 [Stentor coeruleus]